MRIRLNVVALAVALYLPTPTAAQTGGGAAPAPCSRPGHRQFDFWLGDWEVTTPDGKAAGTNRIQSIHGGCALREEWSGASGFSGTSLNAYDTVAGRWHQTWIGSDGVLLRLDGGMKDGAMELGGETVGVGDARILQRIRWTPLGGTPARVRQLWETSTDGGRTWSVVFDGMYRRKG